MAGSLWRKLNERERESAQRVIVDRICRSTESANPQPSKYIPSIRLKTSATPYIHTHHSTVDQHLSNSNGTATVSLTIDIIFPSKDTVSIHVAIV